MMGHFSITILLAPLIFVGLSRAAPSALPGPEPEPEPVFCNLLGNLLYSILTPLLPLICELLQLLNGLTTFLLHAILRLLLDYLGIGEIAHDTIFNILPGV